MIKESEIFIQLIEIGYNLSKMCIRDRLIPNSANAQYWFERAAEQGHIASQYSLAKLYLADDRCV